MTHHTRDVTGDLYTGTQEAGPDSRVSARPTLPVLFAPSVGRRQAWWLLGTLAHAELVSWVICKPSDYLRINVLGGRWDIEVQPLPRRPPSAAL